MTQSRGTSGADLRRGSITAGSTGSNSNSGQVFNVVSLMPEAPEILFSVGTANCQRFANTVRARFWLLVNCCLVRLSQMRYREDLYVVLRLSEFLPSEQSNCFAVFVLTSPKVTLANCFSWDWIGKRGLKWTASRHRGTNSPEKEIDARSMRLMTATNWQQGYSVPKSFARVPRMQPPPHRVSACVALPHML